MNGNQIGFTGTFRVGQEVFAHIKADQLQGFVFSIPHNMKGKPQFDIFCKNGFDTANSKTLSSLTDSVEFIKGKSPVVKEAEKKRYDALRQPKVH